jgi:hypothetical protein
VWQASQSVSILNLWHTWRLPPWPQTHKSEETAGLLIWTLISENHGLDKSRYISKPRKISGSASLDFFRFGDLDNQVYSINSALFQGGDLKNKVCGTWNFLRFEIDLNFSRSWFSEIKVQIKRPRTESRK